MKAAVFVEAGEPLQIRELPRPALTAGQALIRVAAAALNPLDAKIRAGGAPHAQQPAPAILGIDVAGVVEAVAPDVTRFAPGDTVYGMIGGVGGLPGSFAEYVAVDARLLARAPRRISLREAAALPLIAITAWEGLVDRARVHAGQRVLIQAGAGGVGHLAIQIARARGAEVFATDRSNRAALIESFGAQLVDPESPEFSAGFDIVYDTAGGALLDASFRAVRRFGHVVSCLGWGTHSLAPLSFKGGTYSGVFTLQPLLDGEDREHLGEILTQVADLVDAGSVRPRVDPRRFTLEQLAEAERALSDGSAQGKIVISLH